MSSTSPESPRRTASRLAERLGAPVILGHYSLPAPLSGRCSCCSDFCAEPGAHPLGEHEAASRRPWSMLLPLGSRHDVLDVPLRTGRAGLGYLRLWAVPLEPVIEQAGRMIFLVEPEGPDDLSGLMIRERLGDPRRGIRYRSEGYQALPPSNAGTAAEARWVVSPDEAARRRPAAGELLGALALATHQLQRLTRSPVPIAVGL